MLDIYYQGSINRISPEAPIPIVDIETITYKLGGACNVVANLKSLGANPLLLSGIGNDEAGSKMIQLLNELNIDPSYLLRFSDRPTTKKTRIIAKDRQILRLDEEVHEPISKELSEQAYATVEYLIKTHSIDGILFEDYDKGFLNLDFIKKSVRLAKEKKILTFADPKKRHFWAYEGVNFFKPNLKELREALESGSTDETDFKELVQDLRTKMKHETSFITLSHQGIYVKNDRIDHLSPASPIEVTDVTGAGDTVIALATLCYLSGLDLEKIALLCNKAGGEVCKHLGSYCLQQNELIQLLEQ